MNDGSVSIIVTTITVVGGLATAYIVNVVAKRKKANKPKDRMETIFDGYEKLISSQQVEIDRKGNVISSLENVVKRLDEELSKTRELLNDARTDLSNARQQNEELKNQLMDMRKDYQNSSV